MSRLESWAQRLDSPPVLLRYWMWTVAMTLLSLIYTETMIHGFHSKTTLGPEVLWNSDRWWDFLVFQERFEHFRTAAFWNAYDYPFTYPAAMALVFEGMYKVPHALRIYLLTCVAALVAWAWMVARGIAGFGNLFGFALAFALTIPATAWPVWLLLGSANTEGLVAMVVAAGVWAVLRRRWYIGAALIGIAGSLKIFPLAMLALLLSKRRYKEFAGGLAVAAALTLGSLALLGPGVSEAQRHIDAGFGFVKRMYALNTGAQSLDVNHSLFSPVKFGTVLAARMLHGDASGWLDAAFDGYTAGAILLGALLWFVHIRRLPVLNQVLALTVCAVLLPPYSVDYTLIHLLVPCGLLCVYAARMWQGHEAVKGLHACFGAFAFLFTIGTYFSAGYRFGSQVRMVALVVLLVTALRDPFAWDELEVS